MKERLDVLLVQRGYFPSREKAKGAIMAGLVYVNKAISDKPGMPIKDDAEIWVKNDLCPYVGRGGLKLEKALKTFDISVDGLVCTDIGASTGGFTDCMLQNGAVKVYAIDVGYGQLDYKLRVDDRVINMEKTNVRYLDTETFEKCGFVSIDVSFISLNLVLPVAAKILTEGGSIAALVKPQFEAGREQIGKHGIVSDPKVHEEVLQKVCGYAAEAGLVPVDVSFSPMTGAKGNIEYLLHMKPAASMAAEAGAADPAEGANSPAEAAFAAISAKIPGVVEEAHKTLKK
ncbi:MAG: TlyA family RNA methyltransferase [Clostridiales bacterium]|nr:TlyA family RNA methyltransferase [Clostridiales bacterium]